MDSKDGKKENAEKDTGINQQKAVCYCGPLHCNGSSEQLSITCHTDVELVCTVLCRGRGETVKQCMYVRQREKQKGGNGRGSMCG